MGTMCADHKLHLLSSTRKPHHHYNHLHDLNLNIPPRKLLSRRPAAAVSPDADFYSDCPSPDSAALMQKFLPFNGDSDDGFDLDSDPYSSDLFRMFEFKVRRCTRSRSHDWTDCPFAHPGEKARRRDPRKYHYSGTVCPEYRRGVCGKGDECEFAHGVFECWLHPARYRTEACKDGKNCKRKVCFFAHSARELRILPSEDDEVVIGKYRSHQGNGGHVSSGGAAAGHCCKYCCSSSPTSTLHMSPPQSPMMASPPPSPMEVVQRASAGFSRFDMRGVEGAVRGIAYKEMLNELMGSMENVNLNDRGAGVGNGLWVDVYGDDCDEGMMPGRQLVMSPSSTKATPPTSNRRSAGGYNCFDSYPATSASSSIEYNLNGDTDRAANEGGSGSGAPDLGWVNDLLM
ncbi:hypothetical protein Droror1_Dr00003122 [Drosera rotundifolia]